ncbi:MAG TPA: hypothetical protein VKY89_08435 [Thermoanaerobaculia bacterium]|jgi:hypothetical protein|nr:hypothetical protein [Thermoanaerobaculia bacterium]
MTQHASLSPGRWSAFSFDQQILMIANEMNRASRLFRQEETTGLALAYERVLRLVDLTVEVQQRATWRRELLRWRDIIADVYIQPERDLAVHTAAFRALLLFSPEAARQIPFVLPDRSPA